MNFNFTYNKTTGRILCYSEKPIITEHEQIELDITEDEYNKLIQNWHPYYKDGGLIFEKPDYIKRTEKDNNINDIKEKIESAENVEDIKKLLKKLLNNI